MTAPARTDQSRWPALYVLCVGVLMIVLDATIVNVALPSIAQDLHFTPSQLTWVVNAYLIAFGSLLLLAGRIGDVVGRRRVFLAGLAIFTVASGVCAMAPNQAVLIGARFVQGAGGALTSAVVLGMIVTMFPEPREQAKAIGVYGFVASAGGSIGLFAGGVLTELISWHWIFLVNLPIGAATAILALRWVPGSSTEAGARSTDIWSAALLTSGLMVGVYGILGAGDHGWLSSRTLAFTAVAIGLLVTFLVRQTRVANPLMPLRLFRCGDIAAANLIQCLLVAGMFSMFVLGALYLQEILQLTALQVGLAFLPCSVVMGAMSLRVSAPLAARLGIRTTLIAGMVVIAAGLLLFARTPVDGHYLVDILPPTLLIGIGMGAVFPVVMTLAMAGAEPGDSGLASGLVNTTAQIGGAVGLAVLATLAAERTDALGGPSPAALNAGYHLAYLVGAALVGVALVLAAVALRPKQTVAHDEPVEAAPVELAYADAR